jgi:hypothetical protein
MIEWNEQFIRNPNILHIGSQPFFGLQLALLLSADGIAMQFF